MKFRIVEKQYESKTEFHSEWFCDNENACNYGWNNVHDGLLNSMPTSTFEDSLNHIKWFSRCFEKPINEIIHSIV